MFNARSTFFWNCIGAPYKAIGAVFAALSGVTLIRDEFLPLEYRKYHVVDLLPDWPHYAWAVFAGVILLIALGEGLYQQYKVLGERAATSRKIVDHSGNEYESIPKRGWIRAIALPGLIIVLIGIVWYSTHYSLKKQLEDRLGLSERYSQYEWPLSAHASLSPMNLEGETLKAKFIQGRDDYRLTPNMGNDNQGIPVYEPRIAIRLPASIEVRQTQQWLVNLTGKYKDYHAEGFGPLLNGEVRGVNESLFLKFPGPGQYPVVYVIKGIAADKALERMGSFTLEVQ